MIYLSLCARLFALPMAVWYWGSVISTSMCQTVCPPQGGMILREYDIYLHVPDCLSSPRQYDTEGVWYLPLCTRLSVLPKVVWYWGSMISTSMCQTICPPQGSMILKVCDIYLHVPDYLPSPRQYDTEGVWYLPPCARLFALPMAVWYWGSMISTSVCQTICPSQGGMILREHDIYLHVPDYLCPPQGNMILREYDIYLCVPDYLSSPRWYDIEGVWYLPPCARLSALPKAVWYWRCVISTSMCQTICPLQGSMILREYYIYLCVPHYLSSPRWYDTEGVWYLPPCARLSVLPKVVWYWGSMISTSMCQTICPPQGGMILREYDIYLHVPDYMSFPRQYDTDGVWYLPPCGRLYALPKVVWYWRCMISSSVCQTICPPQSGMILRVDDIENIWYLPSCTRLSALLKAVGIVPQGEADIPKLWESLNQWTPGDYSNIG